MHCQMQSQIHYFMQSQVHCDKQSPIHSFHLCSSKCRSSVSREAQSFPASEHRTTATSESRFTPTSDARSTANSLHPVKPDCQRGTSDHVRVERPSMSELWEQSQIHPYQLAPSKARSKSPCQCILYPTSRLPGKPHTPHALSFWQVQIHW